MRKTITILWFFFIRHVHCKSIKMLNIYYPELMGKIKENEGKKYLIIDD